MICDGQYRSYVQKSWSFRWLHHFYYLMQSAIENQKGPILIIRRALEKLLVSRGIIGPTENMDGPFCHPNGWAVLTGEVCCQDERGESAVVAEMPRCFWFLDLPP